MINTNEVETQIQHICIEHSWTLSVAESCTGGALAARLTRLPGCSQYFLGSIVSYSNELKINILGVNSHTLNRCGAVSAEVVEQMALGSLRLTGSDYSIAISGIAGPSGGTVQKPVGLIFAAIGSKDQAPYVWSFQLSGTRIEIIEQAINHVLEKFLKLIKNNKEITSLNR